MEVPLLYEIVIIFLLSIFVTIVCNKIKLPATVGFLLTGVLCGPSLLGIVKDMRAIDHIAELGVAMLLFTIGMELSGEALNRLSKQPHRKTKPVLTQSPESQATRLPNLLRL
mgnify:CR=1 FL=1